MVKITVELNENMHRQLKNIASKNLRSMRNELLIILSKSLVEEQTDTLIRSGDKPRMISGMEFPELWAKR